jgi:hypothetical protein
MYVLDQKTGKLRPPASAFEPRLRVIRPDAREEEQYLSVNLLSSLLAAELSSDWGCDHARYYVALLAAGACIDLALWVTWEPDVHPDDTTRDNPHHGGLWGVVEMFHADRDQYDILLTRLAKAAEVIPECLATEKPA